MSRVNRSPIHLCMASETSFRLFTIVHYVHARDDFEQKVARINKRLIHLVREGEAVRRTGRV